MERYPARSGVTRVGLIQKISDYSNLNYSMIFDVLPERRGAHQEHGREAKR